MVLNSVRKIYLMGIQWGELVWINGDPDFSYFWHGVGNFRISCSQWCSQFVLHTCPLFVLSPYVLTKCSFYVNPTIPMCIVYLFLNLSLWMHTKGHYYVQFTNITYDLWCIINFKEEKKEYEKVSWTHNAHQINKSGGLKVH